MPETLPSGRAITCSCGVHNFGQVTWMTLAIYANHGEYCSRVTRSFTANQSDNTGIIVKTADLDNRGNVIA